MTYQLLVCHIPQMVLVYDITQKEMIATILFDEERLVHVAIMYIRIIRVVNSK